jgi:hypothetical protein
MANLKFRLSILCEIGKSSLAATYRVKVLSSDIFNRPPGELPMLGCDSLFACFFS